MTTSMLIDALHPEEVRVAVVKGNRLEEFDYETSTKVQLKGNIYLAKVTRVEPSLQAAFVDYGSNRHGFLAFNEIHPDYYQIPVADRQALIEAQAAEQQAARATEEVNALEGAKAAEEKRLDQDNASTDDTHDASNEEETHSPEDSEEEEAMEGRLVEPEEIGGDDEDIRPRSSKILRSYKIQEVIKRHQIILVQVVKEERGSKGAALTTYVSLAGRYCVLMPNTARGGGISRKISDAKDRRRLKQVVDSLEIPGGMALIVRTAGSRRTKAELRRDYDYLYRLWDEIRETTLASLAPALVHEEANLIKRSIRDIYNKDIEEILVQGETAYKVAKKQMRMLLPSHAKRVQPYKGDAPVFTSFNVDAQLDAMLNPKVELKSGGQLVINTTEALVAIDVNSGRSTRERNIEATALKTNIEAAQETARQLRLRDLAGLIVIDFIDMEDYRNNRAVERKLKDALKSDRARIQVGRISSFGLLEMSRQRLRPSILEASTETCASCAGSGFVRSTESASLHVLRGLEDDAAKAKGMILEVSVPNRVALYLLNQKRSSVRLLEQTYEVSILVADEDSLVAPNYRINKAGKISEDLKASIVDATDEKVSDTEPPEDDSEGTNARTKRRRRGRRGGRRRRRDPETADRPSQANGEDADLETTKTTREPSEAAQDKETGTSNTDQEGKQQAAGGVRSRRRRGRKGARRTQASTPKDNDDPESLPTATTDTPLDALVQVQAEINSDSTAPVENGNSSHPDLIESGEKTKPSKERAKLSEKPSSGKERPSAPKRRGWWNKTDS